MKPVVSVVIAAKNEERHVEEAVRSILAQDGVAHELIFIDDGSTDRTLELVRAIAAGADNVRIECNPKRGKVSAFNYGVSLARGDWVCLFAGDDIMPAGALAARWNAVRHVSSSKPVVGLSRLITMSTIRSQHGHVVPKSAKKGGWTGLSYMMDRRALAMMFPVPEELPNEDTWLEVTARHFDFEIVHSSVIGAQWRVHEGNSINLLLPFDEFDRLATPRRAAPALFLERHGASLSSEKRRAVAGMAACEEARKARSLVGIFTSGAGMVEKMRSAAFASPFLYNIRRRFYGLLSGW